MKWQGGDIDAAIKKLFYLLVVLGHFVILAKEFVLAPSPGIARRQKAAEAVKEARKSEETQFF